MRTQVGLASKLSDQSVAGGRCPFFPADSQMLIDPQQGPIRFCTALWLSPLDVLAWHDNQETCEHDCVNV